MQPSILQNEGQSYRFMTSSEYSMPSCHIHNQNELLFVISGELTIENNLQTATVKAPCVVIHNSYTLHRVTLLSGKYKRYIITFNDSTLDAIPSLTQSINYFKESNMTVVQLSDGMCALLRMYMDRYEAMSTQNGSWDALTCLVLYEISLYRSDVNTIDMHLDIPYINNVMNYIAKHFSETVSLDMLASEFFVSRAKLTADFANATGMTVKQYSTLVRMNVAMSMIVSGTSISETAHACGYSGVGNFSNTFTRYFGNSPTKYRQLQL